MIDAYDRLAGLIAIFGRWGIARFDVVASETCARLRLQRLRMGTMDMRIAAIALASDALLLTANIRHFEEVPGLRFENWLA